MIGFNLLDTDPRSTESEWVIRWRGRTADRFGRDKTFYENSGAKGMEGTLSARPRGVAVPSQDGCWSGFLSGAALAVRPQLSEFLERRRLTFHAGAAMLTSVAAVALMVEQVPDSIAPGCAAMAAVLATVMAGFCWASPPLSPEGSHEPADIGTNPAQEPPRPFAWAGQNQISGSNANLAAELAHAAAMAQLTARISHDLRTPLNAVIGFSELMSQETFGPLGSQRYQDYAKHIRECGQNLLKSTEDTLAITSALAQPMGESCSPGMRPLSLEDLTNEAWACVALHATHECITLDCEIPDALELFGDRRVMRQVLVNLFQDAISRGGWQSRIVVRAGLCRHGIRLTIETSGCREIEQEEPLSLSVARALLELHGLPIETSRVGQDVWRASVDLQQALQADFFFDNLAA